MDAESLKFFISKVKCKELTDAAGAPNGNVVLGPVRLAFANLAEPKADDNGKMSYQAALIIPSAVDISALRTAAGRVFGSEFGEDWKSKLEKGVLKSPFKPQSKMAEKYDGFEADGMFINVKRSATIDPIACFDRAMNPMPLSEVYSGMWCVVQVRPYAYKTKQNSGVSFGINSLQFLAHDDKFESTSARDGFDAIEAHDGAAASKPNGAAGKVGASADMW